MASTGTVILGKDCKLFYNTGSYGTPTWTEISDVRDLKIALEMKDADATSRASGGFEESEPTLLSATPEWDSYFDTASTPFVALETAFFARTAVEFLVFTGASAVAGNRGLRAACKIHQFDRDEPIDGVVKTAIKIKPCKNANAAPTWFIAP